MNKIYRIFALLTLSCLGWSCGDSFLDREPSDSISDTRALSTYSKLVMATNALYAHTQNTSYYGEFMVMAPDALSDNLSRGKVDNSGRYLNIGNLSATAADISPECLRVPYMIANSASAIIDAIDGNGFDKESSTEAQVKQLQGEALFMRALAHFDACRMFAYPYNFTDAKLAPGADGKGGHLGVPVVTQMKIDKPARKTVALVYEAIIGDLTRAIGLMTEKKAVYWASAETAKALLARVYLYKEDYQNAAQMATEVIGSGRYTLTEAADYVGYWKLAEQPETIFELQINLNDPWFYGGFNNPGGIYGSYRDLVASEKLFLSHEPGDVRANMMALEPAGYVVKKYPGRGVSLEENNPKVIRLAEMYLIRAEANYSGNTTIGATPLADLDLLRSKRGLGAIGAVNNTAIAAERQKELAFEGHRWFDLGRTKQNNVRPEIPAAPLVTYPDKRYVLPLPQDEIKRNPNLSQYPGY